jgi:ammonia channel protein AmtB
MSEYFGLKGVLAQPSIGSTRIPSILFCIYQLMFAAITAALAVGAIAERGRLGPTMVFIFIWSTIVYDPIACWTWNSNGWSFVLGGLDFAGGTPVHISSGMAGLAISIYLGKRRGYGTERLAYKPHNATYVVIGTVLLWFGWFGFNGGSALSANLRAIQACIVTNLAASVGGMTWMFWVRCFFFFLHLLSNLHLHRIIASKRNGAQSGSALVPSQASSPSHLRQVSSALQLQSPLVSSGVPPAISQPNSSSSWALTIPWM